MKRDLEAQAKLVEQQRKMAKEELATVIVPNIPKDNTSSVNKEVGSSLGL